MEGISKQVGQFDAGNGGLEGMKHAILLDLNGILCDNFQKFLEGTYFIIFKLSTVYIRKMFLAHSIFALSISRSCREESLALVSAIK